MTHHFNFLVQNQHDMPLSGIGIEVFAYAPVVSGGQGSNSLVKLNDSQILTDSDGNVPLTADLPEKVNRCEYRLFYQDVFIKSVEFDLSLSGTTNVEVKLHDLSQGEGSIAGHLFDSTHSEPLVGVSIAVKNANDQSVTNDTVITDNNGAFYFTIQDRFFLNKPENESLSVSFFYETERIDRQEIQASELFEPNLIFGVGTLATSVFEVEGHVTNSANQGLSNYPVQLLLEKGIQGATQYTTDTDQNGFYHLEFTWKHLTALQALPEVHIVVKDPEDNSVLATSPTHTLQNTTGNTIDIQIDTMQTSVFEVEGHITNSANQPLRNHPVYLLLADGQQFAVETSTSTDANGFYHLAFTIEHAAALQISPQVRIQVRAPEDNSVLATSPTHTLQNTTGNTIDLQIDTMQTSVFEVEGHITNSANQVLHNYPVQLLLEESSQNTVQATATTNANGFYHLEFAIDHSANAKPLPKVHIVVLDPEDNAILATSSTHTLQNTTGNTIDIQVQAGNINANIQGKIVDENYQALAYYYVAAYHINGTQEVQLGNRVQTNAEGKYNIDYQIDAVMYAEQGINLVVKLLGEASSNNHDNNNDSSDSTILMQSPIIFNASLQEEVNLALTDDCFEVPLFDTIADTLQSHRAAHVSFDNLSSQDLEALAYVTKMPALDISVFKKAEKYTATQDLNLSHEVLYGLFKQMPEASLLSIALCKPTVLEQMLSEAVNKAYVSKAVLSNTQSIISHLHQYAAKKIAEDNNSLYNKLMIAAGWDNQPQRQSFIAKFLTHQGSEQAFWTQMQSQSNATKVKALQQVLSLVGISKYNMPLITSIVQDELSPFEMSRKSVSDWESFLQTNQIDIPEDIQGNEQRKDYALYIKNSIEAAYPTLALLAKIDGDTSIEISDLAAFYEDNPDFDFDKVHFSQQTNSFDYSGVGANQKEAFISNMKCIERLYAITPTVGRFDTFKALYNNNIHSALAVVADGKAAFRNKMQTTNLAQADIDVVFEKAEHIMMQANMILAHHVYDAKDGNTRYTKGDNTDEHAVVSDIFSHLDYCSCEHCQSVYGPAAYLTDVLNYLSNIKERDTSLLDKLHAKRPDLEKILLNCSNTHTLMPFIDLVNEVLENAIAPPSNPNTSYQTHLQTADIKAYPEHLNQEAYNILKAENYPWTAPFHLWNTEVRAYLKHIHISKSDMLKEVPRPHANGTYHAGIDYAADYFGIDNVGTICDNIPANITQLRKIYGMDNTCNLEDLKKLPILLKHSGMSLDTLQDVLQSTYVNPFVSSQGVEQQIPIQYSNKTGEICDIDKAILPFTLAGFIRLYRFRRLQLKLNWSTAELDKSIQACGGAINEDFIVYAYHLAQLKERYHVDIAELNAWFANMDTLAHFDTEPGLYQSVFLNSTMMDIPEAFVLGANEVNLLDDNQTDIRAHLQAALAISAKDLSLLLTHAAKGNTQLESSLTNLSELYKYTSLCKALHISIEECITLSQVMGGINNDPYPIFETQDNVLYFVQEVEKIKASPWQINDLNYLLLGAVDKASALIVDDKDIAVFLEEARKEQRKIRDKYMLSPIVIDNLLSEVMDTDNLDDTTFAQLCHVVVGQSDLSYQDQKTLINNNVARFNLQSETVKSLLVEQTFENQGKSDYTGTDLNTAEERLDILLDDAQRLDEHPDYERFKSSLQQLLALFIDNATIIEEMIAIIVTPQLVYSAEQADFIRTYFSIFMDADKAMQRLLKPEDASADNHLTSKLNRILFVNRALVEALMDDYLYQKIADIFGMEAVEIKHLCKTYLYDTRLSQPYIQAFKRYTFISSTQPIARGNKFSVQYFYFELIYKALLYVKTQHLSAADVEGIYLNFESNNWLRLGTFAARPLAYTGLNFLQYTNYERWSKLEEAIYLNQRMCKPETSLFALLSLKATLSEAEWFEAVAQATVWDVEANTLQQVAQACGYTQYATDFENAEVWLAVEKVMYYAAKLQLEPMQLIALNRVEASKATATQIRKQVKAGMSNAQWLKEAPAIRKPIREAQRQALLDYLVYNTGNTFADANDIYAHFLIDPQMSACAMTSRLKQATLSVQLFVQRVGMGLETLSGIKLSEEAAAEWEWRKQYRVWEANRKIYVQTENYLAPELRRDKSELFAEVEKLLKEDEVNDKSVDRIYRHYLNGLSDLAHLEICDISANHAYQDYHNLLEKNGHLYPGRHKSKRTHVLARSRTAPHTHYYRYLEHGIWSPWQTIDVEIGDNSVIVEYKGQVFVAWIEFITRAKEQGGDKDENPQRFYELRLGWTQYHNGEWSGKHLSTQSFNLEDKWSYLLNTDNPVPWFMDKKAYGIVPITPWGEYNLSFKIYTDGEFNGKSLNYGSNGEEINYLCRFIFKSPYDDPQCTFHWFNAEDKLQKGVALQNGTYIIPSKSSFTIPTDVIISDRKQDGAKTGYRNTHSLTYNTPTGKQENFKLIYPSALPTVLMKEYKEHNESTYAEAYYGQDPLVYQDNKHCYMLVPYVETRGLFLPVVEQVMVQEVSLHESIKVATAWTITEANTGTRAQEQPLFYSKAQSAGYIDRATGQINMPKGHCELPGEGGGSGSETPPPGHDDTNSTVNILPPSFLFRRLFHPVAQELLQAVNYGGIKALLQPDANKDWHHNNMEDAYITGQYPANILAFGAYDAYALYNWELFFHIPMMIAERLTQNQRYAEAQQWYHYIFNPFENSDTTADYWKIKPLKYIEEAKLFDEAAGSAIEAWKRDPFNPHKVASMRPYVYRKHVFMKYLDNLIAWGDHLFARDSMESINEATQIYVMAANLLGRKPEATRQHQPPAKDYATLRTHLDDFGNAMVEITEYYWGSAVVIDDISPKNAGYTQVQMVSSPIGFVTQTYKTKYFGIPQNDKLLSYWDTVADRLFKIRHCMNIKGVERQLALFQPPIDPALLAKAMAGGLSLNEAMDELNAPLSYYRFRSVYSKALELAQDVKNLGQTLLAALEKKDAEALSLLRAGQEAKTLDTLTQIKTLTIEENEAQIHSLQYSQQMAKKRENYYAGLVSTNLIEEERNQLEHTEKANKLRERAQGVQAVGSIVALMPQLEIGFTGPAPTVTASFGSMQVYNMMQSAAQVLGYFAGIHEHKAQLDAINAGHSRRKMEWEHQQQLAQQEQAHIQKQILAAEIRLAMARAELHRHEQQIAHTEEYQAFLQDKFTNEELYAWMVGQISDIYFQSYRMATDMAKKAERSFRYETGKQDAAFVNYGHWDTMKKGLLAGDKLIYDLKRMDVAYMDQHERQVELSKPVSLALVAPAALLDLRQHGQCTVELPEILFDLDYPGMYKRRIKSVSISIPGVKGAHTNISCQLSLINSRYRKNTHLINNEQYAETDPSQMNDERFVYKTGGSESIATSTAQNDSGLFQLNFNDERYLPFEGAGAISTWHLELPAAFRTFDYNTIEDVILHINYTASQDRSLKGAAEQAMKDTISQWVKISQDNSVFVQLIDIKTDFPQAWEALISGNAADIVIEKKHFPFFLQDTDINVADGTVEVNEGGGSFSLSNLPASIPNSLHIEPTSNGDTQALMLLLYCEISAS